MRNLFKNLENFFSSSDLMNREFLSNSVFSYIFSIIIFITLFIILLLIQILVFSRIQKRIKKTKTEADDYIFKKIMQSVLPLLYFGIFYISIYNLKLSLNIEKFINVSGKIIITILCIKLFTDLFEYWLLNFAHKYKKISSKISTFKLFKPAIIILIWILGTIFLMSNLGLNVSAIITGLGIGGIAIALALQTVFGDLFSYFSIILDQIFEVGDFIVVDDIMGTVQHIGIKTIRITDIEGEEIIIPNRNLTSTKIKNYKRMKERRICFNIGIEYKTDKNKLAKIPELIRDIIIKKKHTRFDRSHFKSFGDFSLIFESVYFIMSPDYNLYMDIQHRINLKIFEEFKKQKISFAFLTQNIFLKK